MKIAFVSQLDSKNVEEWSGTPYFTVQELKKRGHTVTEIGPLFLEFPRVVKVIQKLYAALTGKVLDLSRHPRIAKSLSNQALRKLEGKSFDLILCPSSVICAGLETSTPIVTWEDATFAGMVNYYPGKWSNFSKFTIQHANTLQQLSLNRAALSVYASDWAAQSALKNYQVKSTQVAVIPLGANLLDVPSIEEVNAAIAKKSADSNCRFLFLGVDWHRKGGDLVLETVLNLRNRGINAMVDIVGCTPPFATPDYARCHGFVSKSTPEGKQQLWDLLLGAHYLFVPSVAECYGLVFAEASAFGVPSLARATGGIPAVVKNGINGWAFNEQEPAQAYADHVTQQLTTDHAYAEAALKARQYYEQDLNWGAAIKSLELLVKPLVGTKCC
jgi:glycosyltransferase involved in cell wall biosynthesis